MAPPTVSALDDTVTVRVAPSDTAPVPRLRSLMPANVKSPDQVWALFDDSVIAPPLVLPSVPPAMTSGPVPIAVAELRLRPPAFKVVVPV